MEETFDIKKLGDFMKKVASQYKKASEIMGKMEAGIFINFLETIPDIAEIRFQPYLLSGIAVTRGRNVSTNLFLHFHPIFENRKSGNDCIINKSEEIKEKAREIFADNCEVSLLVPENEDDGKITITIKIEIQ